MRKLILQMNITLDGFVGSPDGKLDWMLEETDERQVSHLHALIKDVDTILMGRGMALEAVPHWEHVFATQKQGAEREYANFFVNTPKIIFSKTLQHIKGKNNYIMDDDVTESITELKTTSGKDIIVYGGARFVGSLIEHKLIDELNLFIHPVAIGKGLSIFNAQLQFELTGSEAYSNGIVLNTYKPS